MNKQLGFVCGLVLLMLMGCGDIDWSQLVATATPVSVPASVEPTEVLSSPSPTAETAETAVEGLVCEIEEQSFLIVCVANTCLVRTGVGLEIETRVVYSVPQETLLSAFGICECQQCVPFERWYWLGEDQSGIVLWAVVEDHIWQRIEE